MVTDAAAYVTTYGYDSVGNRTSQNVDGSVTEYSYNGLKQLTKAETATEEIIYEYDQRGNQVRTWLRSTLFLHFKWLHVP